MIKEELPEYQHILYGTLSVVEFAVGTPLNILCLLYFVKKTEKSNSRFQYICINTLDAVICFATIIPAISSFSKGKPVLFNNDIICTIHGMIGNIGPRLSVFLIAELSVTRAISLVYPLRVVSRRRIIIPIVVYTVLQVFQATLPYWFKARYKFSWMFTACVWTVGDLKINSKIALKMIYLFTTFAQFFIPLVPICGSCLVICHKLMNMGGLEGSNTKTKKSAAVTVIILTIVYFVFNIVYILLCTGFLVVALKDFDYSVHIYMKLGLSLNQILLLENLTFVHSVALNSMVNAIVYFCRIQEMKTFGRSFMVSSRQGSKSKTFDKGNRTRTTSEGSTFGRGFKSESESTYVDLRRFRTDSDNSIMVIENKMLTRIRTESEGSRSRGGASSSNNSSIHTDSSYEPNSRLRPDPSPKQDPSQGRRTRTVSKNSIKEEELAAHVTETAASNV